MPVYDFKNEAGEIVQHYLSFREYATLEGDHKTGKVRINDEWHERYIVFDPQVDKNGKDRRTIGTLPGNWPMRSNAAGCNPEQIAEMRQELARHGVTTEFDPETGEAIFRDPAHRRQHCEALGFFDRNGGYGDPQHRDIPHEEDAERLDI